MKERLAVALCTMIFFAGCGDDGTDGQGGCPEGQVAVTYIDGPKDGDETCEAAPSVCGANASCDDIDCFNALLELCEDDYVGVGCSPATQTLLISCNPPATP